MTEPSDRLTGDPCAALVCGAAALVAVVTIWIVWPGYMSPDSYAQLRDARAHTYDPWHPPLMAWTWHWLDKIVRGPAGLMAVQCMVLQASLAAIAWLGLRRTRWAWLVLVIGALPPVFVIAGHLWKDALMAIALVAAVALLALARDLPRPRLAITALVMLLYATGIRQNASLATLPLTLVATWLLLPTRRPAVRLCAGLALAAAINALSFAISVAIADGRTAPPPQTSFLHDIVGISKATGKPLLPASFLREYPHVSERWLRDVYRPDGSDPFTYEPGWIAPTFKREVVSDLRRTWVRAVVRHPLIWLRNRGELSCRMLGIGTARVSYPWHPWAEVNDLDVAMPSRLETRLFYVMEHGLSDSALFRGWFYIVLAVIALAVASRRRRIDALTLGVAASMSLYLGSLVVFAPTVDFRYIYWIVLGALILPWITPLPPAPFVGPAPLAGGGT